MKIDIKRPAKRLHSGQWKALCGLLFMISAIAIVWALVASLTLWQRNRDLAKATEELNDMREDFRRIEERAAPEPGVDLLPDDYLPETEPATADDADPFEIFEEEMGLTTDEE